MAFLAGLSGSDLVQQFGLQNTEFGKGVVGFDEEKAKASLQLNVFIALFAALLLGITAVILLSTGVDQLETYGEYFKSTRHQVGVVFAVATMIALIVTNVMLSNVVECAETTLQRRMGGQQVSSGVNPGTSFGPAPFVSRPPSPQFSPVAPMLAPAQPPPPSLPFYPGGGQTVPVSQPAAMAAAPAAPLPAPTQQQAVEAPLLQPAAAPLPAPITQPAPVPQPPQPVPAAAYPTIPVASPTAEPTPVLPAFPPVPQASLSWQQQIGNAVALAAPIALAAATAQRGQERGGAIVE